MEDAASVWYVPSHCCRQFAPDNAAVLLAPRSPLRVHFFGRTRALLDGSAWCTLFFYTAGLLWTGLDAHL